MAKGDKVMLWGVSFFNGKCSLESVEANEREGTYKTVTRASLAMYGYRMVVSKDEACLSPQQAVDCFRGRCQEEINVLERRIARLKGESLKALEALEQHEAREEKGGGDG